MSDKSVELSQSNLERTFPNLKVDKETTPGKSVTLLKDKNGKELVQFETSGNKSSFIFSPDTGVILSNKRLADIPPEKTLQGIVDLYQALFLSDVNQKIKETAGEIPEFFWSSGIMSTFLNNPLQAKEHNKLNNFEVKSTILKGSEIGHDDPTYSELIKGIEDKTAQDPKVLAICLAEFEMDMDVRGKGKNTYEKSDVVLLIIRGKFAKKPTQGAEREFSETEETKIVVRKLGVKKSADYDDKLLSAFTAFLAESNALRNVFRG